MSLPGGGAFTSLLPQLERKLHEGREFVCFPTGPQCAEQYVAYSQPLVHVMEEWMNNNKWEG